MLQGVGGTFIYASQAAAEIALGNNMRRADIRIINTDNGQVYDIDGRPTRYNTGQSDNQQSSGDQEFSGTWEVVSRPTDEVVHTINGIGNAVSDAERYANRWVDQTGFSDPIYVRPRMQPRSTGGGGFNRAPHTSIYQVVDNRDGQVILDGATRTFAYTVEMTNIYIGTPRYNLTPEDIRIIDMATNRSYNIDGSPANTSAPAAQHTYEVTYTVNDGAGARRMRVPAANANAAMNQVRDELQQQGLEVESISADAAASVQPVPGSTEYLNRSLAAQQASAQGTESLPPGNARWLVLDPNDREVYSFVHRSNQGEANVYAANWLRDQGLLGTTEFMVVPAR
jgi:hypothetical protein